MERQDLSVIVPSYNVESTLARTLDGLLDQDYPSGVEIIVVDAGSDDGTGEVAREYAGENSEVRVVTQDEPRGLAATINEGFRQASTELVGVVNPDCVPGSSEMLDRLVEALDPGNGVVGAQPVNRIPEELVEGSSLPYRLFYGARKPRELDEVDITPFNFQPNGYVCLKPVLEEFGFLDGETYDRAGEDYDLSLRVQNQGYMSAVVPVTLLHYHGEGEEFDLRDFLAKQLQYSEGQGAIIRNYPLGKKYPVWNEFTKSGLYASLFIPGVNLVSIPLFLAYLAAYTYSNREVVRGAEFFRVPFLKVIGDLYNIAGFYKGLLTGRQSSTSHRILEF